MTKVILLAGGKSSRMGRDKLKLEFEGETLIDRAYKKFSAEFDHVLVSAATKSKFPHLEVIEDIYPGLGPMSGLHASLKEFESVFLVAADMPFASPHLAKTIIQEGAGEISCVSASEGKLEPLFAYYSRGILPQVEEAIESGDYSLHRLLKSVGAKTIEIEKGILININRPEDYEKLKSGIELNDE